MTNEHNGANGYLNGHADGAGTALLERPSEGAPGAGVISLSNGTLFNLGGAAGKAREAVTPPESGRTRKRRVNAQGDPLPPLPRNPFGAKHQDELKLAEQVCVAALKPEYASHLATCDISADFVNALLAQVRSTRSTTSSAQTATNSKRQATLDLSAARRALSGMFRSIQSAARQKFAVSNPDHMRDYGVSVRLDSRATITQVYEGILKALQSDTLPGVTPDKVALMTTRYNQWNAAIAFQTGAQSAATSGRAARNAGTGSVSEQRRAIQSAANGLWPPVPENHGVRREFALSPTRNFGVSSRPTARRKKR